ncbi:MAG: hypothetical protein IJL89_04745, partial [Firmicutes bacterium]|nr:hypothetical protein [Bacillota bacterium]
MRQLKMSAGLCAFCGLLYFFARILEIYFFKHYTADLSENMTALFAAQLFRMFFVFIACFGIGKGLVYLLISAGAHIDEFFVDIVILPLSVFIAAVLPFGLEIKHHDKPLLPVEALYYEALDITAEPEIRVVGFFGVY